MVSDVIVAITKDNKITITAEYRFEVVNNEAKVLLILNFLIIYFGGYPK